MENRFTPLVNQTPEKTLDLVNKSLKQMGLPGIKKKEITLNSSEWRNDLVTFIGKIRKTLEEKAGDRWNYGHPEREITRANCAELYLICQCIFLNTDKISYSKAEIRLWGFTMTPYLLARDTDIPRSVIDSFIDEVKTNEPDELAYYFGGHSTVFISDKKVTGFRTRYLNEATTKNDAPATFSISINKQLLLEMISKNEPFVITVDGAITQQVIASKEKQVKFLSTPLYDLDMSVRSYNRLAALRLTYPFELVEYFKTGSTKEAFMNQAYGFGVKSMEEVVLMFRQAGLNLYSVPQEIINEAKVSIKK